MPEIKKKRIKKPSDSRCSNAKHAIIQEENNVRYQNKVANKLYHQLVGLSLFKNEY